MDLFDVLSLIGGLCLFLFGMNLMGEGLEKRAGHQLTSLLGKLTSGKLAGFLTGLGVTAIIQSSSATTVMVVGFVNSGIMTLRQAINVIMGANVGTTVTSWLLSLGGIDSSNTFVKLLKPSSFTPILALIGIVLYMMPGSTNKKKDTATILLGFATLMVGMDQMSASVAGLKEVEGFRNILLLFTNPVLGVLAGAILTAIIQSSSASVGILQALSSTGQITMGAAIPIIMGQNIGTCITAMLSSIGTNRNARRASVVHLSFNIIGTTVLLILFCLAQAMFDLTVLTGGPATKAGIAVAHTGFNLLCTCMLFPASGLLEKLSYKLVPDPVDHGREEKIELDERLMATPAIALDRCRTVTHDMGRLSFEGLRTSLRMFGAYDPDTAGALRRDEKQVDHYEDILGTYLVKLNTYPLSDEDSHESTKLLHMIGDLERISDHSVNILSSVEELQEKELSFSHEAQEELSLLFSAVDEVLSLAARSFEQNDLNSATKVAPLRAVISSLKNQLRTYHIHRMQKGLCSIETGFIWSDLLTNLERVADHCENIAGCVIEMSRDSLNLHDQIRTMRRTSSDYAEHYQAYTKKYLEQNIPIS